MKTARVPFNALPQHIRERLVSICNHDAGAGHHIQLHTSVSSTSTWPEPRRDAAVWGGFAVGFLGVVIGILGLVIIARSDAHWPMRGITLVPFGALIFGTGLTLWGYGYKNFTTYRSPYKRHNFLFPHYQLRMGRSDIVVEAPNVNYTITKTTVTKRRNNQNVGQSVHWAVAQVGSRITVYRARSEAEARTYIAQQKADYKALFDKMQTAIAQRDHRALMWFDPLGEVMRSPEWPDLPTPPEETEPKTSAHPPSTRKALIAGLATTCVVVCLAMAAGFGSGYLSERRVFDDIKSIPLGGQCAYYAEQGGVLFKNDLKKICAKALWESALYNIKEKQGYEARKMLIALTDSFPHKKYVKKAKKKLKLVKKCTREYTECP